MEKTDLVKAFRSYYTAKLKPEYRLTEPGNFLSVIGQGEPRGTDYDARLRALQTTALELRKLSRAGGVDFVIPRLEMLWDFCRGDAAAGTAGDAAFPSRREEGYCLMLRMPPLVTPARVALATRQVVSEGLALAGEIDLHGRMGAHVVQLLHRGDPADKMRALDRLEAFLREHCFVQDGPCHQIYLGGPADSMSRSSRVIIRLPVKRLREGELRLR